MKVSASRSAALAAPVPSVWAAMHATDSLPRWAKLRSATGPSDKAGSRFEVRTWFGRVTIRTITVEPMVSAVFETQDSLWFARWYETGRMVVARELAPLPERRCRMTVRAGRDVRPIRAAVSILLITAVVIFAIYFGNPEARPLPIADVAILAAVCLAVGVVVGLVIALWVVGIARLTLALGCKRSLALVGKRAQAAPSGPAAPTG